MFQKHKRPTYEPVTIPENVPLREAMAMVEAARANERELCVEMIAEFLRAGGAPTASAIRALLATGSNDGT